jgi:hypothetical protein
LRASAIHDQLKTCALLALAGDKGEGRSQALSIDQAMIAVAT